MKNLEIKEMFYMKRKYRELIKATPEYIDKLETVCNLEDELRDALTQEQLNLYEKLIEVIEEINCKEVDFFFEKGFKLGLHMGVEAIENKYI